MIYDLDKAEIVNSTWFFSIISGKVDFGIMSF